MSKADIDNRANQLNPNNDAYWSSRGMTGPGGGDDDCIGEVATSASVGSHYIQPPKIPKVEPITLDVLLHDGRHVHVSLTVSFPHADFSAPKLHEPSDLLDFIGNDLLTKIERHAGEGILYALWRGNGGRILDITRSYNPKGWHQQRRTHEELAQQLMQQRQRVSAFNRRWHLLQPGERQDLGIFGPNLIYSPSMQYSAWSKEDSIHDRQIDFTIEPAPGEPDQFDLDPVSSDGREPSRNLTVEHLIKVSVPPV